MRKTLGPGPVPANRIVLRTGQAGPKRPATPASRPLRPSSELRKVAAKAPRSGATMDYQMGFSSGSSI